MDYKFTGTQGKLDTFLGLIGYKKVCYQENGIERVAYATKCSDIEVMFVDFVDECVSIFKFDDLDKAIELFTGTDEQLDELYEYSVSGDERKTIAYALGIGRNE